MTPRIITYFLCGMRHPTTGLSEDDLSRLTGSSSSSASSVTSSSSSSSSSSAENTPTFKENENTDNKQHKLHEHQQQQQLHTSPEKLTTTTTTNNKNSLNTQQQKNLNTTRFSSTYLPEIINPLEWQKSRKRKERLDSTSSATQDRKLQRSNSEELLPQDITTTPTDTKNVDGNADEIVSTKVIGKKCEPIRRVSSEDFKKSPFVTQEYELKDTANTTVATKDKKAGNENDGSLANRQTQQQGNDTLPPSYSEKWGFGGPTKDMTRRSRYETSPARSHRHSPMRGHSNGNSNSNGNGNGNGKHRDSDDSECEHERRRSSERFCKTRAPPGRKAAGVSKKTGGNSAVKYMPTKRTDENVYKYDLSALKYERRGFVSKKVSATQTAEKANASDHNDNNLIDFHKQTKNNTPISPTPSSTGGSSDDNSSCTVVASNIPVISEHEALPWDRSMPEDQAPVLSRRYAAVHHHNADNIDTAAVLSKVMPYPQQYHKQSSAAQLYADDMDDLEPMSTFRAFTSLENVRTRDVMQQVIPAMRSFQSPEERLKQINKRQTALKKKLTQLEEAYEAREGYRPSQAERLNDKYMKNILAELSKLRKERQDLKSDGVGAVGLKVSGGMDAAKKLEKMKLTLQEIDKSLHEKRLEAHRSDTFEELTPDQLVAEKSAVQHGLLYFESLYGRPNSKEERDVARPIYDRYRQIKRMVSRSVMLSGCSAAGASELPTILEHEAMVFEASTSQQYSSNNSTETTNSPSDSATGITAASSEDSTTTSTQPTSTADANENIAQLSIDELWELLEKTREEKKLLKRNIREYENAFEVQNGRKMLKNDRKAIEETYAQYKEKKAKTRLLQALIRKHISH